MKIIIFSPTSTSLNPLDDDMPMGGADRAFLKMFETLSTNGNEVHNFMNTDTVQQVYPFGFCYPFMSVFNKPIECDVLILYRKCWVIPQNITYKKLIFYSQDTTDTPCFDGARKDKDYFKNYDLVIALSEFHKKNLQETFAIPEEKICIIGNASDEPPKNVLRNPLKFIYISTPYRGLHILARLWNQHISKEFPEAELHVYSSMSIYGASNLDDIHFKPLFDKLRNMHGVTLHGSRPHSEVMKALAESFLLLYPNTYPETYCNVLMEARACKTPFITTKQGALPETGGKAGIYLEGDPKSEEYQTAFVYYIRRLLNSYMLYESLQKECHPYRTWDEYATDLLSKITKTPDYETQITGDKP